MNVAVPDKFANNATQMKVSGITKNKRKSQLKFGTYQTTKVKSGWIKSSAVYDRNSGITKEERIFKVFNIKQDNITENSRNKYQYTVNDGNLVADVYCQEKTTREDVQTNSRVLGRFSTTKNIQYSFSAAILPQSIKDEAWQLVLYSNYEGSDNRSPFSLERPNIDREGYVTNGKLRIDIRPIITGKVTGKDGKETNTLMPLLMAYELSIDGGVIGIVDTFKDNIWIYNDLDNDMKLIVASVSSAILLRRLKESAL